jgi:DNA repair exonuclease SbcCD ATPase subunit
MGRMNVQQLRNKLEQRKGTKAQIQRSLDAAETKRKEIKRSLRKHEKAREIIREVGLKTQQQLQYHISDITSMALEAVFDDPYELVAEFVTRRNKTECDLYFQRGETKVDPLSASGGGAVDVASFALRVASWSMQNPRSRNVLILDEPFKHLKGEADNRKMLQMVKEVSEKLGLQIIMVSDERVSREATLEATDRLFEVSKKNGISKIKTQQL